MIAEKERALKYIEKNVYANNVNDKDKYWLIDWLVFNANFCSISASI